MTKDDESDNQIVFACLMICLRIRCLMIFHDEDLRLRCITALLWHVDCTLQRARTAQSSRVKRRLIGPTQDVARSVRCSV